MSLLSVPTFARRIGGRECLLSGKRLSSREHVISAEYLPQLYKQDKWDKASLEILRGVVETLITIKSDRTTGAIKFSEISAKAKPFFELLLAQRDVVPEYCVHAFMYLYWNDIDYKNAAITPEGNIYFSSSALNTAIDVTDKYYRLISRLKSVINVDLIAVSEERQHIFIIEVKRGPLDDRAVGQVLRYFNESSKVLTERLTREFNLSYIRPVLILSEAARPFVDAFPSLFREVLDVYEYSTARDETGELQVILSHMRRRFLSIQMQ